MFGPFFHFIHYFKNTALLYNNICKNKVERARELDKGERMIKRMRKHFIVHLKYFTNSYKWLYIAIKCELQVM